MPVHIDDEDIGGDVPFPDFTGNLENLVVGVCEVAAPPVAEGVFRGHGNLAGHFDIVAYSRQVVVPVGEDVEIGTLSLRAAGHPFSPVGIVLYQDVALRFVHDGPSVARDHSVFEGFLALLVVVSAEAVQCAAGALKVSLVLHSRFPGDLLPVELEGDFKVVGGEIAASPVNEFHAFRGDCHSVTLSHRLECGDREPAVDYGQRGAVLEDPVCGPFHTDEPVGEDCKPRVSADYRGCGVGLRVAFGCEGSGAQGQEHQGKEKTFHIVRFYCSFLRIMGFSAPQSTIPTDTETFRECFVPNWGISRQRSLSSTTS